MKRTRRPYVTRKPILSTLLERTEMRGDCWIWLGNKDPHGYGVLSIHGTNRLFVHRAAYAIFHPEWDWSKCVLHKCDTPSCWSPLHLFNGTQLENIADMHAKQRGKLPPRLEGESNPRATITAECARSIKSMFSDGMTNRQIADTFGLKIWKVQLITSGKTWKTA